MADNVDQANEKTQALTEGLLALIKENAAIPKGVAGICDECEEEKHALWEVFVRFVGMDNE